MLVHQRVVLEGRATVLLPNRPILSALSRFKGCDGICHGDTTFFIVAGDEDQSQNAVDVWSYLIIEIMIYAYSCTNTANIHTIGR